MEASREEGLLGIAPTLSRASLLARLLEQRGLHTEPLLLLQYKETKTCKHTTRKEGEEEEAMRGARSGERKEKRKRMGRKRDE